MLPPPDEWALSTPQQKALDSLVCERVSANPEDNLTALMAFEYLLDKSGKARNPNVLDHLRTTNDEEGETAVYIVKDKNETGLFSFSLKCGELFFPVCKDIQELKFVQKAWYRQAHLQENWSEVEFENMFAGWWQVRKREFKQELLDKKNAMSIDAQQDLNTRNAHVAVTRSGILLVDLYKNASQAAKKAWKSLDLGVNLPIGRVLFWRFISEIVIAVRERAGCENLFLFAADNSNTRTLVSFYKELGFREERLYGANKPHYDGGCCLMCQRVGEMETSRKEFFANFNKPAESIDVAYFDPNIV